MGDAQREMTLNEWVERLPPGYLARRQYANVCEQLAELARVEAERDAAVAKVAAVRAECALLRRLVVMPGPDGVATHDYAADRIEAALDAPATEEE